MPQSIDKSAFANPSALFTVAGKTALITGASGAFGRVAALTLAGAGAKLVLAAGNAEALAKTAEECRALGAEVSEIIKRPDSEQAVEDMVARAVQEFGGS